VVHAHNRVARVGVVFVVAARRRRRRLRASPLFPLRARRRRLLGFRGDVHQAFPAVFPKVRGEGRGETLEDVRDLRRGAAGQMRRAHLERGGRAGVLAGKRDSERDGASRVAVGDGERERPAKGRERVEGFHGGLRPGSLPRIHERSNRLHAFGVLDDERAGREVVVPGVHRLHHLELHELAL
jgi:hypothetical protein